MVDPNAPKKPSIEIVRYSPESEVLVAQFPDGTRYRYDGVPSRIVESIQRADSQGRAFSQLVRPSFKGVRLEQE